MVNMGIGKLGAANTCFKHKNRWLFSLPDISDDGVNALPPLTSSRPSLTFKEQSVEHTSETIWFPVKPEFKPINLKLYDIVTNENAVFEWIKQIYNPQSGQWLFGQSKPASNNPAIFGIKRLAELSLYNGCGDEVLESWVYENAYPTEINFGELDYADGTVMTIDLTLRYDRAYTTGGFVSGSTGPTVGIVPEAPPPQVGTGGVLVPVFTFPGRRRGRGRYYG